MLRSFALGICAVLMLALLNQACTHDPFDPPVTPETPDTTVTASDTVAIAAGLCNTDTIFFNRDLQPLFNASCAFGGCHDANTASSGVILDNYFNVFNTADVRPGEPDKSDLYEVLTETDPDKLMPKSSGPWSPENIEMVRLWIMQGAKNYKCIDTTTNDTTIADTCITANMSYSMDVVPIFTSYGCIGCHSGGSVLLNSYTGTKIVVDNGRLAGAINHDAGFQAMPQGQAQMDSCDLAKVNAWIADGAPNN